MLPTYVLCHVSRCIDHEYHAEVTLELHVIENPVIQHDIVIVRLNFFKASEIVPVHLAVVGFGAAWPWALWSLVQRAEIGVEA